MSESVKRYTIKIEEAAGRFINKQTARIKRQLFNKIASLCEQPDNKGEKLKGPYDLFKIRSGDYSIIYQVKKNILLVLVVRVGYRKDIYKQLFR